MIYDTGEDSAGLDFGWTTDMPIGVILGHAFVTVASLARTSAKVEEMDDESMNNLAIAVTNEVIAFLEAKGTPDL